MNVRAESGVFDRLGGSWWDERSLLSQMRDFNPLRLAYIKEVLGSLQNKKILDVGCGGGLLSEALAQEGATVIAIDSSAAAIEDAQRHAAGQNLALDYQIADATRLPLADASFDVVMASEVLEHLEDVQTVLAEVSRVLKKGGRFIFDTPNRTWISRFCLIVLGEWVLRKIPRGTHDGRRFIRPTELKELLMVTGMRVRDIRGFWVAGRDRQKRWRFRFTRNTRLAYFGWAERV